MIVDIIYGLLLIILGILGFKKGLVKEIFSIIALIGGFFMASLLYPNFIELFSFLKNKSIVKFVTFIAIYFFIWFLIIIIGHLLSGFLRKLFLGGLDKFLGFLFGAVKATVIFGIIIILGLHFFPGFTHKIVNESISFKFLFSHLIKILSFIKFLNLLQPQISV